MERRKYKRLLLNTVVLINYKNLPTVNCNAINIGANGLLLESNSIKLYCYMEIELEFENLKLRVRPRYKIPARVVHEFRGLLGLKFIHSNTNQYILPQILLNEICQQHIINTPSTTIQLPS